MRGQFSCLVLMLGMGVAFANGFSGDYPIQPVPFTQVHFDGGFWGPRLETNRTVTLPYDFEKCEETARIDNFAKAAGLMEGSHEGAYFNDSDVYKIVEGAAYCLALTPDPELDAYVDKLIALFAGAQEDDGYLYTARTIDPENPAGGSGSVRWENIKNAHELYCVGHMYEAAVAHYQATGKRNFLDVAIKNADLIASVFGPGGLHNPPGHEEIEIGLVKLYRVTGDRKYLDLAKFFLDQRGRPEGHELYGEAYQDHMPVTEQREAAGHAVRAGYLYAGMADVAALTGEQAYIDAIDTLWENVVGRRMYLTGGIGSTRTHEAFGGDYDLPNRTAYNETCAAIANALWNQRLFLLHGDAKYVDVLERIIYNGFLAGIALEGNTFFYPNPLEADGKTPFNHGSILRQPWFGCSCCPSNVVRFLPSLLGYVYAQREDKLYVNLYANGSGEVTLGKTKVALTQRTQYPWDGNIALMVTPETDTEFTLMVRIPGWAQGHPVPSDLYTYLEEDTPPYTLAVNGKPMEIPLEKGYAPIQRLWQAGDVVELHLPMPIRRVLSLEKVAEDRGKVALERGPIVYCAEGVDNEDEIFNRVLSDEIALTATHQPDLLGGVTVITGETPTLRFAEDKRGISETKPFTAIPYYAWAHRGENAMTVWHARTAEMATPAPVPTLASKSAITASHCFESDTVTALNDQVLPAASHDQDIPRMTWWDHKGSREWVQYDFPEPTEISAAEVYWFDDTPAGGCRVPASWMIRCKDGERWKTVASSSETGLAPDTMNRIEFAPVRTGAIKLVVRLQDGMSGGILEWTVE